MVAALIASLALTLGADVIAKGEAAGHVRFHALSVLVVAGVGAGLAWRGVRGAWISAPALGLLALVIAQLVEAVGGAGFDAHNDARNGLAVVHDLGLALTPIGLAAAVAGIAIGVWTGARKQFSTPAAVAIAAAAVVGGLLGIKILIGI